MKFKKLSQIAEVSSGNSAPQGDSVFSKDGKPFVRAGSLESIIANDDLSTLDHLTPSKAKRYRMRLFPDNTVLFAKSGMSAKIGRVYLLKEPAYVVSHLATIIPSDQVNPNYLMRWFQYRPPSYLIPNDSYPSIRLSEISNIKIPLPPIAEQRRIAKILDKADEIRRKRQQAIKLTEELGRSLFLDMFGDPVTNPKGWKIVKMNNIVRETQYGTSQKSNSETKGIPVLRMNNITYKGDVDLNNIKWCEIAENEKEKYTVKKGDLLFNRTNSPELVGKTSVWNKSEKYAFAGYLIRVRFDKTQANSEYVSGYLNSEYGKKYLLEKAKPSINMSNFSASEFLKIPIPLPPIELQNKFKSIKESIQQKNNNLELFASESENLFNSLLQRAFKGEL